MGTASQTAATVPEEAGEDEDRDLPQPGDLIADKYRVDRVLGAGGMGVVVAVTHLQLGEPYAIKFLRRRHARDESTVARFMREARAAARIKSEHVARVSDVGQLPGTGAPFILMEYLTGRDLSDVLREEGPLPIEDAVAYILQACSGIAETHALGFVHRDIKPSNLFLTKRSDGAPLVKVLDFGIAKALDDTGPQNPDLTETRTAFGSPSYMSPEQVRSAKTVDFRSDIWALGVVLYELLTNYKPFHAETAFAILAAIAADPPHPLSVRRPDVSAELESVILRCLEKDVNSRWQSVSELAEALAPFGRGGGVSMGRIRRLSRAPNPPNRPSTTERIVVQAVEAEVAVDVRSRRKLFVVLGAIALLGVAVAVAVLRKGDPPPIAVAPAPTPSMEAPPPPVTTPPANVVAASPATPVTAHPAIVPPLPPAGIAAPRRTVHPSKPPKATLPPPPPAPPPSSTRDPTAESH